MYFCAFLLLCLFHSLPLEELLLTTSMHVYNSWVADGFSLSISMPRPHFSVLTLLPVKDRLFSPCYESTVSPK